jgi:shikimate dehydrogenase
MGLLGNPVEHSRSPFIQNYIGRLADVNIVYLCFKTESHDLKSKIEALKELGAKGFNVTIPYKTEIIKFLDCHDKDVAISGACNTVKISGGLQGFNTDIEGFYEAFIYDMGVDMKDKNVVILGAGGACKSIAYSVLKRKPGRLAILNRDRKRADDVCRSFSELSEKLSSGPLDPGSGSQLHDAQIIINTTSAGLYPHVDDDPLYFYNDFSGKEIIYDIIYNPKETKLMSKAKNRGVKTSNGLSMLIFQAIRSFEIINDIVIDPDIKNKIIKYVRENEDMGELNGY